MADPLNTVSAPATSPGELSPEKPRRQGNDSLWKRARRTLGTNQLTFLQPQSKPSPEKSTKSDDGQPAPSKRREQVRTAQRTHRQRTQNYIKTLEQEVVRLRGAESNWTKDRDRLQGQVDILRATIVLHQIPLPAGIEGGLPAEDMFSDSTGSQMQATISYSTDDFNHQRFHVDWPYTSAEAIPTTNAYQAQPTENFENSRRGAPSGRTEVSLSSRLKDRNNSQIRAPQVSEYASQPKNQPARAPLDSPENAVEFVLALEHPCMAHLSHVYDQQNSSEEPSNHVLTTILPLATEASSFPQLNSSWSVPTANIQTLLNMSTSLNLEGEITPVQAWTKTRQHPSFGQLRQDGLNRLKRELSQEVECKGFGAVLDEVVFWMKLESILGPARYN